MAKRSRAEKKGKKEPIKVAPPPVSDDNPDLPLEVVFATPVKKDAPEDEGVPSERPAQEMGKDSA